MRILIVEDDFVSRRLLLTILSKYGQCDIAVNGTEAIEAFKLSLDEGKRYDLICLDIMMPEKDGHQVLKEIRDIEKSFGILGLDGVKVIMTTALADTKNIVDAFREQCEAYMVKPIEKNKLMNKIEELGLIE